MNGLVVSWFFPPATSAEGLVTFKLLKNSCQNYDVISSNSRQWSYRSDSILESPNVHAFPADADSLASWVSASVGIAEKMLHSNKYDFLMTRAMPPQSHMVGLQLKKRFKSLFWIASMADPIGRNPYDFERYFSGGLRKFVRNPVLFAVRAILYRKNIRLERQIIKKADLIIFPSIEQCLYTLGAQYNKFKNKVLILPHSFDTDMIPPTAPPNNSSGRKKLVLSHLGHLNANRSAQGLIRAVSLLSDKDSSLKEKLTIRLIGNIPDDQKKLIKDLGLLNIFSLEEPVDYMQSLRIMNESDMLILIDADFPFMHDNIFFASKLADYMGANKPVLGLTTSNGPSARIIRSAGCPVCRPGDIKAIKTQLSKILKFGIPQPNDEVYREFDSKNVAQLFDKKLISNQQ